MPKIQVWFCNNSLTVNIKKTCVLMFSQHIDKIPKINVIKYKHRGEIIVIKNELQAKYLGVIIDRHLRWDHRIKYLNNRLRYLPYVFQKLRNIFDIKILETTLYHALFLSILRYGILVWEGANPTAIKPLKILQKTVLKKIHNKPKLYSTEKLFKETKQLNIDSLYKLSAIMYQAIEGILKKHQQELTFVLTHKLSTWDMFDIAENFVIKIFKTL